MVANRPCASAKCDLKEGVAVEETNDSNEETKRERVVRCSLMRFVESVGPGEFGLVVYELSLLGRG